MTRAGSAREIPILTAVLAAFLVSCAPGPGVRSGPTEYEILLKRGDGYYFNSRFAEAAAEYSRAVELNRGRAEAYRFRGYALMALEEWEGARDSLCRAGRGCAREMAA